MFNFFSVFARAVSERWRYLIGNPSQFTLESRVFHSISLGIVVLCIVYIPYNLFAGLYVAALSGVIFGSIFGYEYHRSRFRGLPHRSIIFGLLGLVLFSINYFTNAGIEGSTDLIWPVYLALLLTICPQRNQVTWVIIYLIVFGLVHVGEYLYPAWVQYPFRQGNGQFTDRITAFPISAISIAIIIGMFRRNYDRERTTVAQRDAEKGRLLSILSHDLRAPCIQIGQYLELLEDGDLAADDRTRMEHTLRQANDQTLTLVTNLLYWSRSQLNGVTVDASSLNLTDTLENTLNIARAQALQKNITLKQYLDDDIMVIADTNMLQLVVRNLLQNAIKFTPPGGTISVDTDIVGSRCRLIVSDTGIGMTEVQLATLFSGATPPAYGTANEKGVGLGLQLCREFIEKLHGRISVESKPGEGSRFSVEIPLA